MEAKKYVLYELEKRPDGSIGLGNLIEADAAEAVLLVQNGVAKFVDAPLGVVPSGLMKKEMKKGGEAD